MKLSGLLLLLVCVCIPVSAEFNPLAYEDTEPPIASMTKDFFYPAYFKEADGLTFRNIRREIVFRLEFISGIRPEPRYMNCFKMQKRIARALIRYAEAGKKLVLRRLDDELLFKENSPLGEYLRPMPIPPTNRCSYKSAGDLSGDGMIYCAYHGPLYDSACYQKHWSLFEAEKPFLTAFDFVELLIFLPALLILPITWLIMRKILEKKR
ncbi:MAG: hypothetical protein KKB51_14005 [Candidatus Riflebacteria bacterium]|nr:hypothetical protein [Candidatus Riflebacteria bacterium]